MYIIYYYTLLYICVCIHMEIQSSMYIHYYRYQYHRQDGRRLPRVNEKSSTTTLCNTRTSKKVINVLIYSPMVKLTVFENLN